MANDKATAAMQKMMDENRRVNSLLDDARAQGTIDEDGNATKKLNTPSQKRPDPSRNLGKFLHPKSSPTSEGSKDPNAAGSKVRPGY